MDVFFRLQRDAAAGHLFGLREGGQRVFELDAEGHLVRTYGEAGEGPGRLRDVRSMDLGPDEVLVLDVGSGKVVGFSRHSNTFRELSLERAYRNVLAWGDDQLLLLPGQSKAAFDVRDWTGRQTGALGPDDLSLKACLSCILGRMDGGRVLVLDREALRLWAFDPSGALCHEVDLGVRAPAAGWLVEERARTRLADMPWEGRVWATDMSVLDSATVLLSVDAPGPRGRELWRVDLRNGDLRRYRFQPVGSGAGIAASGRVLFAISDEDGIVREYRIP